MEAFPPLSGHPDAGLQEPATERSHYVCEVTKRLSQAHSNLSVSFLGNGYFANIRIDFQARFKHHQP